MRVLFIKLSDTTDIINTLPAITAFKRDRPESWVVYATFPGVNADIVESCQAVGEVLVVPERLGELDEEDDEEEGNGEQKKSLLSTIRKTAQKTLTGAKAATEFFKRVQALSLDATIDLHVSMRSAVIARNSKAPQVFAFRSENATNKQAALAFANTPYVNPSQPDYEKYNMLIANSLGTSASSQFDWSLPMHNPEMPSKSELQIIPTGMIPSKYWCGTLQLMLQRRIPFRIVDCQLTSKKILSRITNELFGMDLQIVEVEHDVANALVRHGGPIIGDGPAAYLSLALGLNTLAIGEKPTSPFIAQPNTFFYTYPGPKDLPYFEQFVELGVELLNQASSHNKLVDHSADAPRIETRQEPETTQVAELASHGQGAAESAGDEHFADNDAQPHSAEPDDKEENSSPENIKTQGHSLVFNQNEGKE